MEEGEIKEVNRLLDVREQEIKDVKNKLGAANESIVSSAIYSGQNENLIIFQLELDNILEKIEHLLRGDVIKADAEGNLFYSAAEDDALKILNEYGVQLIMNVISFYLNRNTILSFYDPERINEILYDFGDELADVILCNYEKMGMIDENKKSRYPLLVLNIMHIVESTYKRALDGGERESLRSARVVTQSTTGMPGQINPMLQMPDKKNFKMFDPKTW